MPGNYGFRSGGVVSGSTGRFDTAVNAGDVSVTGSGTALSVTNNASIGGNLTITGDLTVNGTTTTIDTDNLAIKDSLIELNTNGDGGRASNSGAGFFISGSVSDNDITLTAAEDGGRLKVSGSTAGYDIITGGDYAINGTQVLSADGATKVQSAVAGDGLAHSAGVLSIDSSAAGNGLAFSAGTLSLDLNELSDTGVDVANDSFAFVDSDDSNSTKKDTISDLAEAQAGNGINASAGVFSVNANATSFTVAEAGLALASGVAGAGLALSEDALLIDFSEFSSGSIASGISFAGLADDESTEQRFTLSDIATFMAGDGLSADGGTLAVDASEVQDEDVDVSSDSIQFIDSDNGDVLRKDTIADLATAQAGNGLGASGGVFAVNVDDSSIEISADTLQVKALGVTNAMLAGSIVNAKLVNDSVTFGSTEVDLGATSTSIAGLTGLTLLSDNAVNFRNDASYKIYSDAEDSIKIENGSSTSGIHLSGTSILPLTTAGANLGSSDNYFANIYTGDFHLKNERGDWTIFEEADHLRIRNNLTGQTYKMGMTLIDDQ